MEVRSVIRTTAELLLLLIVVVLILQLLKEPMVTEYSPPVSSETPAIGKYPANGLEPEPRNYTAPLLTMEKKIFDLVNEERTSVGLKSLIWDDDVAAVARNHSEALAIENEPLTERDLLCYNPLIHHEGFVNGLYHNKRLENNSIFNFASSGENIFLASNWKSRKTFDVDSIDCKMEVLIESTDPQDIKDEIEKRLEAVKTAQRVNWLFTVSTKEEIQKSIVDGWMESEGHKANIINENFTDSGIGMAKINDFYMITQVFIEKVDCGYRNGPCCIDRSYTYCYQPLTCVSQFCVK